MITEIEIRVLNKDFSSTIFRYLEDRKLSFSIEEDWSYLIKLNIEDKSSEYDDLILFLVDKDENGKIFFVEKYSAMRSL